MANTKISALTSATTPLAGTEVLPIVQSGATVKVAVTDLTAGRAVSVSSLTNTGLTASKPVFTDASKVLTSTGVVPVANGGTNASAASITAFNNITGYSAAGATGTTTTNLVFSTSPSITTPTLVGDVTVSTGNVVIGTSGKGIDFSITSHPAGMTSELLADYEEGTWTPTLVASGGGASAVDFTGRYTKIGNVVYFNAYMNDSASNAFGTGTLTFGGLPYTCGSAASQRGVVSILTRRITKPATSTQLVGWVNGSATTIGLFWNGTDGNLLTALAATDVSVASAVIFAISGFYQV